MNTLRFLPEAMRKLPNWGLWRTEPDKNLRDTKVPYSPRYFGKAKSNDPATWGTYSEALSWFREHPRFYNGPAFFVEGSEMVFIDIDHCISEEGQSEVAEDIMKTLGETVFWEVSQSGTGLHGFVYGKIEKSFKNSSLGVEMYDSKRFCACTANALFKREPGHNDEALRSVYEKYRTKPRTKKSPSTVKAELLHDDEYIIRKASENEKSGAMFRQLMSGDYTGFGSQSEADYALVKILFFWCDGDLETIKRIAQSSLLKRDKWNRPDYLDRTIERARSETTETLSGFIQRRRREEADAYYKSLLQSG